MRTKFVFSIVLVVVMMVGLLYAPNPSVQSANVAVKTLTAQSPADFQAAQVAAAFPVRAILVFVPLLILVALWLPAGLKAIGLLALAALMLAACQGSDFVNVDANETAFVVPLNGGQTGDQAQTRSIDFWKGKQQIGVFRIEITKDAQGKPNVAVIKISRAPVTVKWAVDPTESSDPKFLSPRFQTGDSQGFRLPLTVTAQISEQAGKFTLPDKTVIDDGGAPAYEYYFGGKQLAQVLNENVYGKVAGELFAKFNTTTATTADSSVGEFIQATYSDIASYFAPMGVIITNIGAMDGLNWDSKLQQDAIDNKAIAAQNQIVAGLNAKSTQIAVQVEATAEIMQAEAGAQATMISGKAQLDILSTQVAIVNANPAALEIMRISKWNGVNSQFSGGSQPGVFVQAPMMTPSAP